MSLKTCLGNFHQYILLLLNFISENGHFKRLVGKETLKEYNYLEEQIKEFREKLGCMPDKDKELLELNVPLKMLAYSLHEYVAEIRSGEKQNMKRLASLVSFTTRFIFQIKNEYVHRIQEKVKKTDKELLFLLTKYSKMVYDEKFRKVYKKLRYRRPFLDKLYRDYNLCGFPARLLSEIVAIARHDSYDIYLCVLKGGLTYTILLELLGIPTVKIRYIISGRRYEGTSSDKMITQPVGFDLREMTGKNILFVDNNLETGKSIKEAIAQLRKYNPSSMSLFIDYLIPDTSRVAAKELNTILGYAIKDYHIARLRKNILDEREMEKIKLSLIRKLKSRIS